MFPIPNAKLKHVYLNAAKAGQTLLVYMLEVKSSSNGYPLS